MPVDEKISKNFKMSEFACHDGSVTPDDIKVNIRMLVRLILQPLRDKVKKPIKIMSGYRSPAYNRKIKGATHSQHLTGRAADITIEGMLPEEVADLIEREYSPGGLGRYPGFTHVDIRPGRKSRWGSN